MNKPMPMDAILRARAVAARAIEGELVPHTSGATHYHADYVSPYWAPSLVRLGSIGRHIFYRAPGASSFSSLARYIPAGENMAVSLVAAADESPGAGAAPVTDKPREPRRFMPWGLTIPNMPTRSGGAPENPGREALRLNAISTGLISSGLSLGGNLVEGR
jgi:hypothetical protein